MTWGTECRGSCGQKPPCSNCADVRVQSARRPEAIALEELVAAVEGYLAPDIPMHLVGTTKARLTLALNAARNALHMGKVLDGIASDPDIARGHTGSYG